MSRERKSPPRARDYAIRSPAELAERVAIETAKRHLIGDAVVKLPEAGGGDEPAEEETELEPEERDAARGESPTQQDILDLARLIYAKEQPER